METAVKEKIIDETGLSKMMNEFHSKTFDATKPYKTFYFTFGQQYRQNPHPIWNRAHPDGWLEVRAQ